MTTTNRTIEEFITHHGITFSAVRANSNPHMDDMGPDAKHWLCYLGADSDQMHVPFSQGSSHTEPPTATDVLDCLALDASSVENASSFEEWAEEFGYDTDSRKAEKTYVICKDQALQLRDLLGAEAFEELLWNVERL